jgi:hypothetical protein
MTQPPQAPKSGLIGDVLGRVLGYADRPWKAAVIVVALILGGLGWALWQHSDELIEAWLTPSESELKVGDVPEALTKLTSETDADLVQIWKVDLASNSQWFVAARRRDGERPVIPTPRRLPIIVTVSDVTALQHVLEGRPVCLDVTALGSPLARRLAERGMKRGCAVPIPPSAQKFLGVIYLAWLTPVDAASEGVAVGAAREIAATLVSR